MNGSPVNDIFVLGTLEFSELEKFHERMKTQIRKESRVQKISRMFHLSKWSHDKHNKQHTSTPDLTRIDSDNNPANTKTQSPTHDDDGKVLSKSRSFDSLPSSVTRKYPSRKQKPVGAQRLLNDSLLPLTFLAGDMSSRGSSRRTSPSAVSSVPSSRGRSRASTPDLDVKKLGPSRFPSLTQQKTDHVPQQPSVSNSIAPTETFTNKCRGNEEIGEIVHRKLSLDSMIAKIKVCPL